MDYFLFQKINQFAGQSGFWDAVFVFGATDLILVMAIVLVLSGFWMVRKNGKQAIDLIKIPALGVVISYAINQFIGFLYFRPRPFVDHNVVKLIEKSATEKSFPSDHTTVSFAIALGVFAYDKKLGSILLVLAFLVAISRIFVGVHYPMDLLAGFVTAFIGVFIAKKFYCKKNVV